MFRNILAAGAAALVMSAAGAAAADDILIFSFIDKVGTVNQSFLGFENQGSPGSSSAFAEVGSYTFLGDDFPDVQDLTGFATVVTAKEPEEWGSTPLTGPLYLTFDVAQAGGVHSNIPGVSQGNFGRPFEGQIRLRYADTGPGDELFPGALTTLATFDISPDWADPGESFSFDIFAALDSFGGSGTDVTFYLDYANRDDNDDTAWTFGNFRLTSTDQTTALPTTAVPEPAVWALMIVGFGGVGAMLRRRGVALGVARV